MIELIQKLTGGGSAVNVAGQVERLLRSGAIGPDALLPPVRELARALKVSPGTAAAAYKELKARGLVATDGRRGTRTVASPAIREYADAPLPKGAVDLQVANPDPALLPDLREAFAGMDVTSGLYGGPHLEPLLRAWAGKDLGADGVDASELVVLSGAIAALHHALRSAVAPGAKVAVEDPGFDDHHAVVLLHRQVPVAVPVDDEGMKPEALSKVLRSGASAVVLTPRCQSPFGAGLTPGRAAKLRAVLAEHPDVLVLLDDYLSQMTSWPYEDVLGKGRARWLVARSFNKVLGADMRVSVAAGDAETIDRVRRDQAQSGEWVSLFLQRAAARAMASRSVRTAIARARSAYAERRAALLEALTARGVRAHGATGMHVWVPVADEAAVVGSMAAKGWGVRAGARYRLSSGRAVRITVSQMALEHVERIADDLRATLRQGPGSSP